MADAFDAALANVLASEGGFTADPRDPGNWTGGKVGAGACKGTKFGISAGSFPTLDIANLTRDQAGAIYRSLYWDRARCDVLPGPLALLHFDAAVNNGVGGAVRFLQQAIGAGADGSFGPGTLAAVQRALGNGSPDRVAALCDEYQARRLAMMAALPTWATYGLGWARRLVKLARQAGGMISGASA